MKIGSCSRTLLLFMLLALFCLANFVVLNYYIRGCSLPNVINASNSNTSVETRMIPSVASSNVTIFTVSQKEKFPILFDDPKTYKGPIGK